MKTNWMREKSYVMLTVLIFGVAAMTGCGAPDGAKKAAKEDAQVTRAEVAVSRNENQVQKSKSAADVITLSDNTASGKNQLGCTAEGCTIENCNGEHHAETGRTCTVEGCTIEDCNGEHHVETGRTCTVEGCTIEDCSGVHGGSGSHHNKGQGGHHGGRHH